MTALLLSLFFHGLILVFLSVVYLPERVFNPGGAQRKTIRFLVEGDSAAKQQRDDEKEEDDIAEPPSFIKTSPNQETAQKPEESELVGERSTLAEGGPKPPDDIKEMPAQDGEENREEIVLFDQNRQSGDLAHDRDGNPGAKSFPAPQSHPAETKETDNNKLAEYDPAFSEGRRPLPMVPQVAQPTDLEFKDGPDTNDMVPANDVTLAKNDKKTVQDSEELNHEKSPELSKGEGSSKDFEGAEEDAGKLEDSSRDVLATLQADHFDYVDLLNSEYVVEVPNRGGEQDRGILDSRMAVLTPQFEQDIPAPSVIDHGTEPGSPPKPAPLYDPAFTPESQPGFKTNERKTRTSGRFSFGRNASMNVAATPIGRYEAVIYRAIAMCWYGQCDTNRDVIVTGTIRIRVLIGKKGDVSDMRLVSRQGASTVQQSFTYLAIKQAPIPPMPPDVLKEIVGDKLELFFDFNFY